MHAAVASVTAAMLPIGFSPPRWYFGDYVQARAGVDVRVPDPVGAKVRT
jgi:hypothetical protein